MLANSEVKIGQIQVAVSVALLLATCASYSDSRLNKKKTTGTPLLSEELTIKKVVKLPFGMKNAVPQCEVELELRYSQAHTTVRTTTDIKVLGCDNAHGEYRHRVRTVDAQGEPNTEEYVQTWQAQQSGESSGDLRLQQTHTYDLKGDPDLRWVRINTRPKSRCLCPASTQGNPQEVERPGDAP